MARDLLGREQTELEAQVPAQYQQTKVLLQRDELPPGVAANLRQALAALWNIVIDLDLAFEQLYDLGV